MRSLHYHLMKTHACMNRWILGEAAALGLTAGQPKVLECLMQNGVSNQKAIAEFCEIEPATVGSILSRMERDGLICRTRPAENRRCLCVSLTPDGRKKAEQMAQVFRRADERALTGLSAPQQEQLIALLQRVREAMASGEEGSEA